MRKLSIIGGGRVGKTLGHLWALERVFEIGDVLTRRSDSAHAAAAFIGAGRPRTDWRQLAAAEVFMIAVPDDAIGECADRLSNHGIVAPGAIAFHVSGSRSSAALRVLRDSGARVASLHPVKSFADPARAIASFSGTYCALEGDADACAVLRSAVARCGGRCFAIDPDQKLVYHAGTVFASNYVVSLCEVAFRCFERAGMTREQASAVALPLLRGTIDNVAGLGAADALTGPIARGDDNLVGEQLRTLLASDAAVGELYARLGRYAVELAVQRAQADRDALALIDAELGRVLE